MSEGGGKCLKYLKRGWNRKDRWGHKDLKKGGQAGSRDSYLKNGEGGSWNPLTNYVYYSIIKMKVI